jgi:hypothetical protein
MASFGKIFGAAAKLRCGPQPQRFPETPMKQAADLPGWKTNPVSSQIKRKPVINVSGPGLNTISGIQCFAWPLGHQNRHLLVTYTQVQHLLAKPGGLGSRKHRRSQHQGLMANGLEVTAGSWDVVSDVITSLTSAHMDLLVWKPKILPCRPTYLPINSDRCGLLLKPTPCLAKLDVHGMTADTRNPQLAKQTLHRFSVY